MTQLQQQLRAALCGRFLRHMDGIIAGTADRHGSEFLHEDAFLAGAVGACREPLPRDYCLALDLPPDTTYSQAAGAMLGWRSRITPRPVLAVFSGE